MVTSVFFYRRRRMKAHECLEKLKEFKVDDLNDGASIIEIKEFILKELNITFVAFELRPENEQEAEIVNANKICNNWIGARKEISKEMLEYIIKTCLDKKHKTSNVRKYFKDWQLYMGTFLEYFKKNKLVAEESPYVFRGSRKKNMESLQDNRTPSEKIADEHEYFIELYESIMEQLDEAFGKKFNTEYFESRNNCNKLIDMVKNWKKGNEYFDYRHSYTAKIYELFHNNELYNTAKKWKGLPQHPYQLEWRRFYVEDFLKSGVRHIEEEPKEESSKEDLELLLNS
jgi:hypothetical protein